MRTYRRLGVGVKVRVSATFLAVRRAELTRDGGFLLLVAMMVMNAANFLFNIIMSRMLGEAVYGALGSLLGMLSVLGVVVGALQLAVTQAVAEGDAGSKLQMSIGRAFISASCLGLATFVVMVALSPVLSEFLHIASVVPVVLLALYLAPSVAGFVPQGVLIGEKRFKEAGLALIAGAAIRLVAGVTLVGVGMGLDGALLASVLSILGIVLLMLWPLRRRLILGEGSANLGVRIGPAALSLAALGSVAFFTMIDSLLARHYLSAKEAGAYVAASTAARIALFLPGAVGTIAFPRLAAAKAAGTDPTRVLRQSLGLIAGLAGLAGITMLLFPGLIVSVLFGPAYSAAIPVIRVLGLGSVAMALVGQLVYIYVARHSGLAVAPWVGALGAVILMVMFHGTAMSLAWAMLGVSLVLLALMLVPALRPVKPPVHLIESGPSTGEVVGSSSPRVEDQLFGPLLQPRSTIPTQHNHAHARARRQQYEFRDCDGV